MSALIRADDWVINDLHHIKTLLLVDISDLQMHGRGTPKSHQFHRMLLFGRVNDIDTFNYIKVSYVWSAGTHKIVTFSQQLNVCSNIEEGGDVVSCKDLSSLCSINVRIHFILRIPEKQRHRIRVNRTVMSHHKRNWSRNTALSHPNTPKSIYICTISDITVSIWECILSDVTVVTSI